MLQPEIIVVTHEACWKANKNSAKSAPSSVVIKENCQDIHMDSISGVKKRPGHRSILQQQVTPIMHSVSVP